MNLSRLPTWAFAATLSTAGLFAQQGTQQGTTASFSHGGVPVPIQKSTSGTVSTSGLDVFVPRALTVQNLKVTVDIDYPRPNELNIFVVSPQGMRIRLAELACSSAATLSGITFDDLASFRYPDACPAVGGGSYKSIEPLAGVRGQSSFGKWTLGVENTGTADVVGWVRGVTIEVTGLPMTTTPVSGPAGVFSAASLQGDGIAPGELIDVIGAGLGPVGGMFAPSGNLPNSLGGTSVTIGGVPAPIMFASPLGLRIQVPYSTFTTGTTDMSSTLPLGVRMQVPDGAFTVASTEMVITFNGVASTPVPLGVFTVKPALFTRDPSGKGPANALNPDNTPNSAQSPAPKGSAIGVFATGLGLVTPPLSAGQSPPESPMSTTDATITATIDGRPADVQFAGAAPGQPGRYLVNILVPFDATSGLKSLIIYADGKPSQSGVQIWVQ